MSRNGIAGAIAAALLAAGCSVISPSADVDPSSSPDTALTASGEGAANSITTSTHPSDDENGETRRIPEGTVQQFVNARTAFDPFTSSKDPAVTDYLRETFEQMLVYTPYFDSRLAWYPNATVYIDLYAIYVDGRRERALEHPEWILRDADGNKLYIPFNCDGTVCPQFAADPGDPEFREAIIGDIRSAIDAGYVALFLDDVNLAFRVSNEHGDFTPPIDRRTGRPMTHDEWRLYVVEFVELIRATFPALEISHNPIWSHFSPEFDDPLLQRQVLAADRIMTERGATDPGLSSEGKFSFENYLRYIDLLHELGRPIIVLDQHATTTAEHEFGIAAYLLMNEGADVIGTESLELMAPPALDPIYALDLGPALAPRFEKDGLHQRRFTNGLVLVNPPGGSTATIQLDTPYFTTSGDEIRSVTLEPRDGIVLQRSQDG